jgi:hypothetical protein
MPNMMFFVPNLTECSTSSSSAHAAEFKPSTPNLLKLANLLPKKSMNDWSLHMRLNALIFYYFDGYATLSD